MTPGVSMTGTLGPGRAPCQRYRIGYCRLCDPVSRRKSPSKVSAMLGGGDRGDRILPPAPAATPPVPESCGRGAGWGRGGGRIIMGISPAGSAIRAAFIPRHQVLLRPTRPRPSRAGAPPASRPPYCDGPSTRRSSDTVDAPISPRSPGIATVQGGDASSSCG